MRLPVISTDRLNLFTFTPDEAPKFFELNSDEEVMRYTGDLPFDSVEQARGFLESYDHYEENGYGRWSIYLKETDEFVGWCGLKFNELGEVDLGFRLLKKHWNKGYATEAALACLKYGFKDLGMKRILGRAHRDNHASIRVLQKCGMTYWKEGSCSDFEDAVYYKIEA